MEDRTAFSAYTSGLTETDPGVFSITAIAPVVPPNPNITSPGVSTVGKPDISGDVPNYTHPQVGGADESLTTTITALTSTELGTDADFLDVSKWWASVGEMIEDEEDVELAAAQIQKIGTYISAYQAEIQNQLNTFNKENVKYQANVQAEISKHQTDAAEAQKESDLTLQASIQDYTLELQQYGADVNKYQAEVNTQVSEYSQKLSQYQTELQTSLQAWQQEQNEKVARYQAKVQDAINQFNEENVEYQAQLQVSIQNSNLKPNHYANESKKYYEWAVQEVNMYIQNNSKVIGRTMAAQAAQQQRA